MKKALYLILGFLVSVFGIWLLINFWHYFVGFFLGVLGLLVIIVGIVIFVVGWMTSSKEENFNEFNSEEESKSEDK